jgi:uncharacterized membrane protein
LNNKLLIIATIITFGFSAFFRKLAVDKMHPYTMQILSAIVYTSLIPVWYSLAPKPLDLNATGTFYAIVTTVLHVCGAVMFGLLLRSSNSTGALAVMVSSSPAITILLSVLFLQEKFEMRHFIATLLTLAGLTLFNMR